MLFDVMLFDVMVLGVMLFDVIVLGVMVAVLMGGYITCDADYNL